MLIRRLTAACFPILLGCGSVHGEDDTRSLSQGLDAPPVPSGLPAVVPGVCSQVDATDTIVAELVKVSWIAKYPLTRLEVVSASPDGMDGTVSGNDVPALVAGQLEIVNSVDAARQAVVRALRKVSGLPDYGMLEMGPDIAGCTEVPVWTPEGIVVRDTSANWVHTDGVNDASWQTAHREFGKECPLVKRIGNRDIVDPPGDGSTNAPASSTVSAEGVTANAFGLCPAGTPVGTYCKLSYATGVNYTGRTCRYYYGSLRCLLY
jgi:hypothetical protein